ncbi:MAG TPA: hypothetical protein VFK61_07945 [Candidatus Limnocylindria bacterium]|nr:hypothetical protein [Candidatus Limnocylindria bacterium]
MTRLLIGLLVGVLVVGCSGPSGTVSSPVVVVTTTTSTASPLVGSATPTASPEPDRRPLQSLLPSDFRGTEAHTFAVGEEMLAALADAVDARRPDLDVAFASDHGPAFVQMFAIRADGVDPMALLAALPAAAYRGAQADSISVTRGGLGGHDLTVISQPEQAPRLGTFYAFADGGTLIVVQALAEPVAEAAIEAMPTAGSPGTYR